MKLYHLSHIDLDGYGCQYLTDKVFSDTRYYNANYGPEVTARLKEIVEDLQSDEFDSAMVLITDLNLQVGECRFLEKELKKLDKEVKLQLIDHHISGKDSDNQFSWYHLDAGASATKLTYAYLNENFGDVSDEEEFVKAINAIDIWLTEDPLFEFGKVCMGLVDGARELNRTVFASQDREYKFYLLREAKTFLKLGAIALDENCFFIKKRYFIGEENDILDNLVAAKVVDLLTENKEAMSVRYKGYLGLMGYGIGKSSVIGNAFLVRNPEYNFYMDVGFRGKVSFRGNDSADVSRIAKELAGGGGHRNASGARIDGFKESFVYRDIKKQIVALMEEKESI